MLSVEIHIFHACTALNHFAFFWLPVQFSLFCFSLSLCLRKICHIFCYEEFIETWSELVLYKVNLCIGSFPEHRAVVNATANNPQSDIPFCLLLLEVDVLFFTEYYGRDLLLCARGGQWKHLVGDNTCALYS